MDFANSIKTLLTSDNTGPKQQLQGVTGEVLSLTLVCNRPMSM